MDDAPNPFCESTTAVYAAGKSNGRLVFKLAAVRALREAGMTDAALLVARLSTEEEATAHV